MDKLTTLEDASKQTISILEKQLETHIANKVLEDPVVIKDIRSLLSDAYTSCERGELAAALLLTNGIERAMSMVVQERKVKQRIASKSNVVSKEKEVVPEKIIKAADTVTLPRKEFKVASFQVSDFDKKYKQTMQEKSKKTKTAKRNRAIRRVISFSILILIVAAIWLLGVMTFEAIASSGAEASNEVISKLEDNIKRLEEENTVLVAKTKQLEYSNNILIQDNEALMYEKKQLEVAANSLVEKEVLIANDVKYDGSLNIHYFGKGKGLYWDRLESIPGVEVSRLDSFLFVIPSPSNGIKLTVEHDGTISYSGCNQRDAEVIMQRLLSHIQKKGR
jgi:cell division protein FtsB